MSTSRADKPPVRSPELAGAGRTPLEEHECIDAVMVPTQPSSDNAASPSASESAWAYPHPGTSVHWVFLIMAAVILIASCSFQIRDRQLVIIPMINMPLPGTCTFLRVTGVPCPGCGLTRSFISLAHGEWKDAWQYNPAGFVFFAMVVFQVPYRIFQIRRIRRGRQQHQFQLLDSWVLLLLVVALVVQWLWGLAQRLW